MTSRRSSRKKRRPKPPPPPRHMCIVTIKMPEDKNDEHATKRIQTIFDSYFDQHDCIPTSSHVQSIVYKTYGKENLTEAFFSIELSDTEAMAWVSGESMDASMDYRNYNNECPSNVYSNITVNKKNWYCAICLEHNTKNVVCVNNCGCIYHEKCLKEAYKHSKKCAVCSENVDFINIYEPVVEIVV